MSGLNKKLNYKEISKTMTLFFPFRINLDIYRGVKEFEDSRIKSYLTDGYLDFERRYDESIKLP